MVNGQAPRRNLLQLQNLLNNLHYMRTMDMEARQTHIGTNTNSNINNKLNTIFMHNLLHRLSQWCLRLLPNRQDSIRISLRQPSGTRKRTPLLRHLNLQPNRRSGHLNLSNLSNSSISINNSKGLRPMDTYNIQPRIKFLLQSGRDLKILINQTLLNPVFNPLLRLLLNRKMARTLLTGRIV